MRLSTSFARLFLRRFFLRIDGNSFSPPRYLKRLWRFWNRASSPQGAEIGYADDRHRRHQSEGGDPGQALEAAK